MFFNGSLHIVQAITSLGKGGMELAPLFLAPRLAQKGQRVSVWANPDSFLGKRAAEGGLSLDTLRFRGHFNPAGVWKVGQLLRRLRPDIIHLHQSRDLSLVVPALALEGWKGPLVLSKHVASSIQKKDPLHRWLYRRVDLLLACSDFIRQNVLDTCPIAPEKVKTAFVPVDPSAFRFDPEARRRERKRWGWRDKEVVGLVARVTPRKGHELFLRTAAKLLAQRPQVRFRVAGAHTPDEEWYHARLMALRKQLGLGKAVVYEGMVKDVPGFLSGLDVAVHMAEEESFGMAVAEAMACGRPVVVRRGGGVAEVLEKIPGESQGGTILQTEDPARWAGTLVNFLDSKTLRSRLGREARKRAMFFNLPDWVERHMGWYRTLLRSKQNEPVGAG